MKLRIALLFAFSFLIFATNIQAQVAYPRFQKHVVLEGETAQSIADQFHVSLTDFCLQNDFPESVKLKTGQVVLIRQLKNGEEEIIEDVPLQKAKPAKTEPVKTVAEEKPQPAPAKTVVEEKSKSTTTKTTTTTITEKPKPVAAPVAVKKQAAEEPFVVPPPSTKAVEVGPHGVTYNVSHTGYHIVAKNQTFFRIALIYGMSVDELKELNGLSNTTVEIGQKLKVKK